MEDNNYSKLLSEIIWKREFPDYSVFTEQSHPAYFKEISPFLNEQIKLMPEYYCCQEHFEELLINSVELQNQYVQVYNAYNEYRYIQYDCEVQKIDIYFITCRGQITLFFIRTTP